jgi:regulator of protease activity HflC (stomatin/prohibitin superfamily)
MDVRKQYQTKIVIRFGALENFNDSEGLNRTWENIEEKIKISNTESLYLCEQNQYKP